MQCNKKGYDIIGDIHGRAEKLIQLLEHLGYQKSESGYCHPSRKVIFVGDFIDRGAELKQHRQLMDIVMAMVDNQHALAVMGNHEWNALAFHTQHNGEYLRPRTESKIRQHQAFLNEFDHDEEKKQEVLAFFYRLPIYLDLGDFRVIHACWNDEYIEYVKTCTVDNRLTPELLVEASTEGTLLNDAITCLLKGVELKLPYKNKHGKDRDSMRLQWWNRSATTLGEITLPMDLDIGDVALQSIPESVPRYHDEKPPCFIGHYWMAGEPDILEDNIACLDYSAATDGKLVAYRWSGESKLKQGSFAYP